MSVMDDKELDRLDRLANLMDMKFGLPGTNLRMGLDGIVGLIPGIGDTLTLGVSGYIVHRAYKAGVSPLILSRMIWNIFIDWAIGIIPFVGDLFDVTWKANRMNVDMLKAHHLTRKYAQTDEKGTALFI